MLKSLVQRRALWVTGAALLVLALSLSFAPVRTFAGQFLGLFRVQQIAVVPVDVARLDSLHDDPTLSDQLSRLFGDSVTVTKEPAASVTTSSAAEASQLAGFNVRQLGGVSGSPVFTVNDSAAFAVVIDQPRAQAILNDAGRGDLQLPASLDGETVTINIPAGVRSTYNCPQLHEATDNATFSGEMRADVDDLRSCVLLGQIPSPSVETPPNLDMAALAELGLQFAGMSAADARAFAAGVDWTSTLVVPIPSRGASAEQVSVDGVTGTLIMRRGDDEVPQRYMLMWVKDGIVYALSAFGSAADALALGNSLH